MLEKPFGHFFVFDRDRLILKVKARFLDVNFKLKYKTGKVDLIF
jgi:hypothetical protein